MTHKVRGITGPYQAYIPTVFIIQYNHGRERRGEKSVYAGRPAVVLNLNKYTQQSINKNKQRPNSYCSIDVILYLFRSSRTVSN